MEADAPKGDETQVLEQAMKPSGPWARLGERGARRSPFDDPYGPTDECLSSSAVVNMFETGADRRTVDHLRVCSECTHRIVNFEAVQRRAPAAAPSALREFVGQLFESFRRGVEPAREPAAAAMRTLLYVASPARVEAGALVEPLKIEILARNAEALAGLRVWCKGMVSGAVGEVRLGEGNRPFVEIANTQVEASVRSLLEQHERVTERLELTMGESVESPRYVGRSYVDIEHL